MGHEKDDAPFLSGRARMEAIDWADVEQRLHETGFALVRQVLTREECTALIAGYDEGVRFRKTVDMGRYRFGAGAYKYYDYPLPGVVADLRESVYERIAPVANEWMRRLGLAGDGGQRLGMGDDGGQKLGMGNDAGLRLGTGDDGGQKLGTGNDAGQRLGMGDDGAKREGTGDEGRRRPGAGGFFPGTLREMLDLCHAEGQLLPTPLILTYTVGGYNTLHQDLYGKVFFPMQVLFVLSQEGEDFTGGEFVLTEQVPRAQSKVQVLRPGRGDMLIFTTNFRPVAGSRGHYRASMRHGVSPVLSGRRYAMGIIFHDAER